MESLVRVFIASPSDVQAEREMVKRSIDNLSRRLESLRSMSLIPVSWEEFAPIASASPDRVFQHRIISRLEPCNLFIGILYKRYGTAIDQLNGLSGTEVEFDSALENRDRIKIMTYFRDQGLTTAADPEVISQLNKVNLLKKRLVKAGLPYQSYESPEEFGERIHFDLMEAVLEMLTDQTRRASLSKFFKFGNERKNRQPSVMIGYPAIHKHTGSSAQGNYDWQKRLLPNVVYEDFKAIQKIETSLAFIGIEDYSSVTLDHPKLNRAGNRIWLCLPRNELAREKLRDFEEHKRFSFKNDSDGVRHIIWQQKNGTSVKVYSPLSEYLKKQRPKRNTKWSPDYGRIFARDFAILARFKSNDYARANFGRPFYHYFIAGIRGLGTWGVGWFIDRRPDELARLVNEQCGNKNDGDVQALLQITYDHYRIKDVIDVSTCGQDNFDNEMSDE
ncbi:MAG: DUF4062 domain-containing protein, partial [Eubacteriales bacterium]